MFADANTNKSPSFLFKWLQISFGYVQQNSLKLDTFANILSIVSLLAINNNNRLSRERNYCIWTKVIYTYWTKIKSSFKVKEIKSTEMSLQ